jgi:hypothetical protein
MVVVNTAVLDGVLETLVGVAQVEALFALEAEVAIVVSDATVLDFVLETHSEAVDVVALVADNTGVVESVADETVLDSVSETVAVGQVKVVFTDETVSGLEVGGDTVGDMYWLTQRSAQVQVVVHRTTQTNVGVD